MKKNLLLKELLLLWLRNRIDDIRTQGRAKMIMMRSNIPNQAGAIVHILSPCFRIGKKMFLYNYTV